MNSPDFILFGEQHLITLLILSAVTIAIPISIKRTDSEVLTRNIAYLLAGVMLFLKVVEPIMVTTSLADLPTKLPLHLCDIGAILTAIMLINRNYRLYEITYFWAFGGAVQALLTPDLQYGFPHLHFLFYFITHGLIILNVMFATIIFEYRPTLQSIWRTFLITLAYAAVIAPANWLLGSNYLYLCHKPRNPSLLDYFGPWPWYVFVLIPVGFIFFFIYYSPFLLIDLFKGRKLSRA